MATTEEVSNDTLNLQELSMDKLYVGRVKWFNNRSGYGFVTSVGENEVDVFAHHSGITTNQELYKYLVQGEYVQFKLQNSSNDNHPYQAQNITGLSGGPLMCETHFEMKRDRVKRNITQGGGTRRPRRSARRQQTSAKNDNWTMTNQDTSSSSTA